jgi:F-type H+-transporting ATPase subunit b
MLQINATFFIQVANFLVLLFLLNILLYRPIRRILARRNQETETLQSTIEELQSRAGQTEAGIEESKVEARKDGFAQKEKMRGDGLEEQKGILQEAGSSVEAKMDAAKKDIEASVAKAKKELQEQIAAFSRELAQKILGRSVS